MGLRSRLLSGLAKAMRVDPPRSYGGGSSTLLRNRLLGHIEGIYSSPDAYLRGGLKEWRAKARQLVLTNPYARQIQRTLEINLIGPNGIQMRGNVLLDEGAAPADPTVPRETAKDPERNRLIERAWSRFCRADSFDITGQRSFHQFELAIAGSFPAQGGCLVRIIREPAGRSKTPICFELISCEQLDELHTQISDIPGRVWRMGIEYETRTGRRTRYAILTSHPGDLEFTNNGELKKVYYVDARDLIHVYVPLEIGQTREIPWLLSSVVTIKHIEEYEKAHWTRKKVSNNTLGFIQKPEPDAPGLMESTSSLANETDPSTGEIISRSAPGQWIELLPGEVPIPPQFGPDDQMYPQVLKTMLRRMASGAGMSYAGLSKDFSDTNYSSSRMSELQDRDGWRTLQKTLVGILHQRVFEEWLDAAMMSGELPLELFGDYYENPEKYCCPSWIPRSWSFVDPQREMAAYATARNLGLQSAGDQIAEIYGNDLESVWAQLSYEKDLADNLGLDFATLQPGQIPNEAAMPDEQEEEPEPPEEEAEQATE